MELFNQAGGLTYHWRAMRYSQPHWRQFKAEIQSWLHHWQIEKDAILLIGPSSGYTLPEAWLRGFKKRIAIDPDRLARPMFEYKFGKTQWVSDAWFQASRTKSGYEFPINAFERLSQKYSEVPILFCNILGQLPVIFRKQIRNSEPQFEAWKQNFAAFLGNKNFASFHDVYSSKEPFDLKNDLPQWTPGAEVLDHQLSGMFANFPDRQYFKWALTPRQFHLIEAVRHSAKP